MSVSNESLSQIKEKLRVDLSHVLVDADALLQAMAERTEEKLSAVTAHLETNLQSAFDQILQFDLMLSEKTSEATQTALKETSAVVKHAIDASKAALVAVEQASQQAAQRAGESTKLSAVQAIGGMKEAVEKACKAIKNLTKVS